MTVLDIPFEKSSTNAATDVRYIPRATVYTNTQTQTAMCASSRTHLQTQQMLPLMRCTKSPSGGHKNIKCFERMTSISYHPKHTSARTLIHTQPHQFIDAHIHRTEAAIAPHQANILRRNFPRHPRNRTFARAHHYLSHIHGSILPRERCFSSTRDAYIT